MILIVGSSGSQGQRYQSILNHIEEPYILHDLDYSEVKANTINQIDGVIIATPTNTHIKMIEEYAKLQTPIFCEKPVCKDSIELEILLNKLEQQNTPFSMAHQYRKLVNGNSKGATEYDYFKHGNDGLIWDCIQIIGLADGLIDLSDDSPIWKCQINGEHLNIADMDNAYVEDVISWLNGDFLDPEYILKIHQKTESFAKHKEMIQ